MKTNIDTKNWNRNKQYEWFKNFSNSTYAVTKKMDITNLLKYTKDNNQSFFINMMYIVVQALNSIEQMRMRYEEGEAYIYDKINPAYTIMTKSGDFENVRHEMDNDFKKFYKVASNYIEKTKNQISLTEEKYNPEACYNEYYITSLPWISINNINHPIPDDKSNASIPRICWDKYQKIGNQYEINLNITVNHMFVDGYPLAQAFIKIQELLDDVESVLK